MSAIGDFVNAIQRIATVAGLLPGRKVMRVLEPLSAVDNPDTGTTDLSVTGGGGGGGNAYSTTTASFVQPDKGGNVQISVDSAVWMVPLPAVLVDGGGLYTIVSKDSPTLATLQLQFDIAESGSTVNAGKLVVPTGFPGQDGKSAVGQLDGSFTQPAVGSNVTVNAHNLDFALTHSIVFLDGAGHSGNTGGYYQVITRSEGNITLKNLGYPGNATPGDSITYPQDVTPGGLRGASGTAGATGATGATGAAFIPQKGFAELAAGTATVSGVNLRFDSVIMLSFVEGNGLYTGDPFAHITAPGSLWFTDPVTGHFDIQAVDVNFDIVGAATPKVFWTIL